MLQDVQGLPCASFTLPSGLSLNPHSKALHLRLRLLRGE